MKKRQPRAQGQRALPTASKHAERKRNEPQESGVRRGCGTAWRPSTRHAVRCTHGRESVARWADRILGGGTKAHRTAQGKGSAGGPNARRRGHSSLTLSPPPRRAERARVGRTHRCSLASIHPREAAWAAATHAQAAAACSNKKAASIPNFYTERTTTNPPIPADSNSAPWVSCLML